MPINVLITISPPSILDSMIISAIINTGINAPNNQSLPFPLHPGRSLGEDESKEDGNETHATDEGHALRCFHEAIHEVAKLCRDEANEPDSKHNYSPFPCKLRRSGQFEQAHPDCVSLAQSFGPLRPVPASTSFPFHEA